MILLNNKIFVDLPELEDVNVLKDLDEEICFGLARAQLVFPSVGYEYSRGDTVPELYNHDFKDVKHSERELTEEEIEKLKLLSYPERQRYLKYAKRAYHPWSTCYGLHNDSSWNTKSIIENKVVTEEAQRLFPKLLNWCYSLPIFEGIGRICIFGVDACQHVTCHRDLDPQKWPEDDEFIMVCPRGDKRFFVYDRAAKTKHYPQSKVYMFHDLNYHGVEAQPFFTYSFRVDGKFSAEFRKTITVERNL